MRSKALSNFPKLNDSDLETLGFAVVSALTDNPNFPDIGQLLTDLSAAQNVYSEALATASIGNPSQIAEKRVRRQQLLVMMKSVCDYVNYVADGDRAILLTTAFLVNKESRTPVVLQPLKLFKVVYGDNSGSLKLMVKKGAGTTSMLFEYTFNISEPNPMWVSKATSESSYLLEGLPVGQEIMVRAAAIGSRRQMIYSDPIRKIIV